PPPAPSDLTIDVLAIGKVELNWVDNNKSDFTEGFKIQRKDNIDTSWVFYDSVAAGTTEYIDSGLVTGRTYSYRVCSFNTGGNSAFSNEVSTLITGSETISSIIPDKYELYQNYPNPFNPVTKIQYDIPKQGIVTIKIFDVLGRETATLVNELQNPGRYSINWNAASLGSGVYFYKIETEGFSQVRRMVLIK